MIHENSFAVSRFENRNGVISWRVAGWLHGGRIRKNFKSKEEAAVEKAVLELKALQIVAGLRTSATCFQLYQAGRKLAQSQDRPPPKLPKSSADGRAPIKDFQVFPSDDNFTSDRDRVCDILQFEQKKFRDPKTKTIYHLQKKRVANKAVRF